MMKPENLISERDELRNIWHNVRMKRLEIKSSLLNKEKSITEVRNNSEYKKLKKEQRHISKMIRHIENKICRANKNES